MQRDSLGQRWPCVFRFNQVVPPAEEHCSGPGNNRLFMLYQGICRIAISVIRQHWQPIVTSRLMRLLSGSFPVLPLVLLAAPLTVTAQHLPWRCADLSFLDELEAAGARYTHGGIPGDAIRILKDNGLSGVRLRLFHTPAILRDGLQDVRQLAQRLDTLGLPWMLDIHYSDTWADPGHQSKPAAWRQLSFEVLEDSVALYTERVLEAFDADGIRPAIVQIGNEITSGFLWNDGRVGGAYDTSDQWARFAALLRHAAQGVRAAVGTSSQIMVHLDRGGDEAGARWFFDNLSQHQVDYDIIGLSYYPWWHGSLEDLVVTLDTVTALYAKPVMLAEIAYPWTLQWFDDTNNIVGLPEHLLPGYPATPEGQRNYIRDVLQIIADTPGGLGACYWEAAYVSTSGMGSPWENVALFDSTGEALPAASALGGTHNTGTAGKRAQMYPLQVYPNPVQGVMRVAYDQPAGSCSHVALYDALGRVAGSSRMSCAAGRVDVSVHVDGLAAGLYLVRVHGLEQVPAVPVAVIGQ